MLKVKEFVCNAFGEITYIVYDTKSLEAAIVDPGMSTPAEEEMVDAFVAREHLQLKYLVLTHLHIDHAWGVPHVKHQYKLPLTAHNDGGYLGAIMDAQAQMFGLKSSPGRMEIENPLHHDDTLTLGNEKLEVLHVPGHSPGGIALYAPTGGFLLAGDIIFRNSIGRTDLPGGDYRQLISGIKEKILTLPPQTVIYSGHGEPTTVGDEARTNPYL